MMEDAREQYLRLVEVSPGDASGYQGLAESLLRLGRLEEADAVLARGLGRVPNSPELRVLEGRRFIRGGQYERAVSNLAPLVTGNDGPAVSALSWTAVAQLALGELREARAASLRAVELDPFDPVAVYTLALVLTRLRDPVAGTWAERARRLFAHDLPALQALELARTAAAGERENKKRKSAH
jgi:Flp pilus assembly protein TadD